MKKHCMALLFLCVFLCLLLHGSQAHAKGQRHTADGDFGLGIGAGTLVSGLSLNYYLNPNLSLQGTAGAGRYGSGIGADLLYHFPALGVWPWGRFGLLVGGGLAFQSYYHRTIIWEDNYSRTYYREKEGDLYVVLSGAFGGALNLEKIPLEFTLEMRPLVMMGSSFTDFHLFGLGSHVRYYF